MKTTIARYSGILTILLVSTFTAYSSNTLSVVRSATNTLDVQLANSDEIYAVQFSLRTSSDVALCQFERGSRTSAAHWLVASYKPNDSTVNVVIISMESRNFSQGQGGLGKISFIAETPNEISHAVLTNAMITNSRADSLGLAVNNLDWSNKSGFLAENKTSEIKSFALGNNFPNPFNPTTKIAYQLNKPAQVRLSVYDITGREVNRLIDQYQSVGNYNIDWNSNDQSGQKMASGMYFARLSVDNQSMTRKMVMAK